MTRIAFFILCVALRHTAHAEEVGVGLQRPASLVSGEERAVGLQPPAGTPDSQADPPPPNACGRPEGSHCDERAARSANDHGVRVHFKPAELVDNFTDPVPRPGSEIDIEAFLLQAVVDKNPTWDTQRAGQYVRDLPKASAEFAKIEETARSLLWAKGELGGEGWSHYVHTRIYDSTPGFYDPFDTQPPKSKPLSLWKVTNDTVTRTRQVNEVTQSRELTAQLAVWHALEAMEKRANEIAVEIERGKPVAEDEPVRHPRTKVVVRLEAQHSSQRQVDCVTGADIYRVGQDPDTGELRTLFGSSLTLVTARIVPLNQLPRTTVTIDADKAMRQLLTSPGVIKTRSVFDIVQYGDECFMVPPALLSGFLDGYGGWTDERVQYAAPVPQEQSKVEAAV